MTQKGCFLFFLIIIVTIYAIITITIVVLLVFFLSLSLTHKEYAVVPTYYDYTGQPTGYPARGCADGPIVKYTPDANVHGAGAVL